MDDIEELLGSGPIDASAHNLRLALKLAAQGFPVFPCRAKTETVNGKVYKEKSPLTKNGFKDASTKETIIRARWARFPGALVGMPTGKASGFAVLDLDRHEEAKDGVRALKKMGYKPEDLTPIRVKTAGNGIHLLFKWRDGITNADKHLPLGMDVRAEGGFIIAPGSRFQDGRMWSEVDLLQAVPDFPEAFMPPPEVNRKAGETGSTTRLDLTVDEIRDYLEDLPNDDGVERGEWIAVMASLHHEATAPNEDGVLRPKSEQDAICKLALDWTAKSKKYGTAEHLRLAKQDFWSFRSKPHGSLATFRSIAKQVLSIRREREMDEALGDFDDVGDDLGEDEWGEPIAPKDEWADDEDEEEALLGKSRKKKKPVREDWQNPAAPKYVRYMNMRHAVVRFNAKAYIVDFADKDEDSIVSLGDEKSLHLSYANRLEEVAVTDERGKIKIKEMNWSQLWLKSPFRRYYPRGITFNPRGDEEGRLNLWKGYAVHPSGDGSCDLLINHIHEVLCRGNAEHSKVFLDFMAHMVQKPWERPTFSIVMRGEMGAGKDTPFTYLGKILGAHYITVGRNSDISGRFNSHIMGKILVHLQEGFYAGSKEQQNYMKFLLSSTSINIERKGVDIFSTTAYHRIVISSNEDWVAPAAWGERRYFVLDVDNRFANGTTDESSARNKAYFDAMEKQMMREGGLEAFMHLLQTRDLSSFDTRRPPRTAALAQQVLEGLENVEKWWYDSLEAGTFDAQESTETAMRGVWERDWITKPTDDLFNAYERWRLGKRYRAEPVTRAKFGREVRRLCPSVSSKQVVYESNGDRKRSMVIPKLSQCRRDFEQLLGSPISWGDEADETSDATYQDDLG